MDLNINKRLRFLLFFSPAAFPQNWMNFCLSISLLVFPSSVCLFSVCMRMCSYVMNKHDFVGGVPDARLMTAGKFLYGFVGCISDVYIQALGPIDFSERAISGVNVQPCSL